MSDAGVDILDRAECMALLASQPIGRLAVVTPDGKPLVFPVNFAVDEGDIVFRTAPGAKLDLAPGHTVAFQADQIDLVRGRGWSVLAVGVAEELTDEQVDEVLARRGGRSIETFAPGVRDHWVRVQPGMVSGRRVVPEDLPFAFDPRGYL